LLSAELGGLPLALRAAADYVKSVGSTLVWSGRAGITDFESYRAAVRRRFESPPGAYSRDLNEPLGLELAQGVFDLSLDLLAQRGLREAAPLLKLFACLNVAPIPYRVLLGSDVLAQSPLFTDFTEMKRVTVLDALADLGLIEPHMLKSRSDPALAHVLSLHPLVHGILRDDEDVQRHRGDYYGLNVQLLLAATRDFDPDYAESWGIWDIVAPHALEVARAALLGPEQLADRRVVARALELARLATRYLVVTGLLGPAHDLVTPIIADCASFGFQRSDREILALRHEAGRIALERGDPRSAEAEFRQVIAERTRILGENHADTLASRHKLAKAIFNQGRWAEAEPVLRAVVLAENEVRGPEHADTMVVRHSLASAILALGRAAEAEEMLRDILRVRDSIWPPTTPETLHVRQTLARSLLAQSKAAEAETEIRDALRQAGERRDSPIAMYLRYILCTVLLVFPERVSELVEELNLLLKDRRRVLGPTHPETERTAVLLSKAQLIPHPRTGGEDRATSSLD
jgi:tetratricopeptide (TPR) repeat protein